VFKAGNDENQKALNMLAWDNGIGLWSLRSVEERKKEEKREQS